jgi:pimeloyl-ACP methyl ester carboxylesterase
MTRLLLIVAVLLLPWEQAVAASAIEVHCRGQGPVVYLIGGGPAFTTWHLEPIQERLSDDYRVCRLDMRGVGDNAGLPIEPDVPVLRQWLEDMDRVLPEQPVLLWGHSWGALQAMLFARAHPGRVRGLILSNPVDPGLSSLEGIEQKRFNHPDPGRGLALEDIGTPAEALHHLRSKVASYFVDPEQGWDYVAQFDRSDANNLLNVRIWDEYRRNPLVGDDVRELADKIRGVIYCRDDVLQPEALAEYRRLLGGDKHHVLTRCAHFPWEENPQDYFTVLRRLLAPK